MGSVPSDNLKMKQSIVIKHSKLFQFIDSLLFFLT